MIPPDEDDPPVVEPLAWRNMVAILPSGELRDVSVWIGYPHQPENAEYDWQWYCAFQVLGVGEGRTIEVFGTDPLHALTTAMLRVSLFLRAVARRGEARFRDEDLRDFGDHASSEA